jgi:hypothetical protein
VISSLTTLVSALSNSYGFTVSHGEAQVLFATRWALPVLLARRRDKPGGSWGPNLLFLFLLWPFNR